MSFLSAGEESAGTTLLLSSVAAFTHPWVPFWGSSVSIHRLCGAGQEHGNAGHDVQRDPLACSFQLQMSSCSCSSPWTRQKQREGKKENHSFPSLPGDTMQALKGWVAE